MRYIVVLGAERRKGAGAVLSAEKLLKADGWTRGWVTDDGVVVPQPLTQKQPRSKARRTTLSPLCVNREESESPADVLAGCCLFHGNEDDVHIRGAEATLVATTRDRLPVPLDIGNNIFAQGSQTSRAHRARNAWSHGAAVIRLGEGCAQPDGAHCRDHT